MTLKRANPKISRGCHYGTLTEWH